MMCVLKVMKKPWFILLIVISLMVILLNVFLVQNAEEEGSLQLVQVYFIHGQTTASRENTYANDPYINETYYPFGRGQLTLEGKRTMYKVGSQLASKYSEYLGIYTNQIAYGVSSYHSPAWTSLQTVLAVMFPPTAPYFIQTGLKWQPADFDYLTVEEDDMLAYWGKCEDALRELQTDITALPRMHNLNIEYSETYKYISQHSGENITNAFAASEFYKIFNYQKNAGVALPEWTNSVYPQPLRLIADEMWKAQLETFNGRKYASGKLLKTIYSNAVAKMQGKQMGRKLYLYSGHSTGLSAVLTSLNIQHDYNLAYGSYIILELHKIDGVLGFKILLQEHTLAEPRLINIGNCDEFCPLEQYHQLTQQYYPSPDVCE